MGHSLFKNKLLNETEDSSTCFNNGGWLLGSPVGLGTGGVSSLSLPDVHY